MVFGAAFSPADAFIHKHPPVQNSRMADGGDLLIRVAGGRVAGLLGSDGSGRGGEGEGASIWL